MKENNVNQIKRVMSQEIDNGLISGAAICIYHEDELVYHQELGCASLKSNQKTTKDTIFRLHSMTKPITAVAAMILYERGQLNLFSPVADYLEGFSNQKVYTDQGMIDAVRPVRIQDLMNMTSGIVYPDANTLPGQIMEKLYDEVCRAHHSGNPISTLDFCNRMGQVPLLFQPGESWNYGASADVLGAVIEVITGKKLSEFLQEEVFTPLGMTDTEFYVPIEKQSRFAQLYEYNDNQKKLEIYKADFLALFDYLEQPAFESGGAGLVSTIEDYSRFAMMLLNKGTYNNQRILGRKSVEYIATPQLNKQQLSAYNWEQQAGYNYGNYCRILVDTAVAASNGSVGEFGWDGYCGNYFMVDPKENLVMVYLVQRCGGSGSDYMRRLRNIIYGAL